MKRNLYIDFDGVILDSIPSMNNKIKEEDEDLYQRVISHKQTANDNKKIASIIGAIDWEKFVDETPQINDSVESINYLIKTNIFNVAILTHVSSFAEIQAKFRFIKENIHGEIDIICVPKKYDKTIATRNCKNSILVDDYTDNLLKWEKEGGIGVKFDVVVNRTHPEFRCVHSLKQLVDMFNK